MNLPKIKLLPWYVRVGFWIAAAGLVLWLVWFTIGAVSDKITLGNKLYKEQQAALRQAQGDKEALRQAQGDLEDSVMTWQQRWASDSLLYNGQIQELQKLVLASERKYRAIEEHLKEVHADSCSCYETTVNWRGKRETKEVLCSRLRSN